MFGFFKKKEPSGNGPDFSNIKSVKQAIKLFEKNELEKLYLVPLSFGGTEDSQNTIYVPIGVATIKERIDNNIIMPLVKSGKATQYSASPLYDGDSFIPSSIKIEANNPGQFTTNIAIWGSAQKK